MKKIYLLLIGFTISFLAISQTAENYPDLLSSLSLVKSANINIDEENVLMQCTGNSSFSNLPFNCNNGYTSYIPLRYKVYQPFTGVQINANQVTFWAVFSSGSKPAETYEFIIETHQPGAYPGTKISSNILELQMEGTGAFLFGYFEIFRCTATITPISVSEGWISIQGTANNSSVFYWVNSGDVNGGNAYQEGNDFWDSSMSICIGTGDAPPPTVVCNPIDINLDADGKYKLDSLDMIELTGVTPDSLTTFDDMKIFAYPDTFTTANIEWPVFVRVTQYDGNFEKKRCWAMVTVHDSMPPTVVGNDIEVMLDSAGLAVITKEQVTDPATFDVSGIASTSIDKDTFTCENIGENWVMLSATDIYGNVGTDSVLVNVKVDMPAIDSIQDIHITLETGVCETTIEYPIPVLIQICGISATQTAGLGRDGLFPVGTTTESWTIIDHEGDTTLVSFDVIVTSPNAFPALDAIAEVTVDEDAPEISVPVTGITYGNDCQAQTVTVVAKTDNTALVDSIAVVYTDGDTTAMVLLTLVPDMNGTAKITVTITDSEGASMFRHFNLVVNEVVDTISNKDGNLATAVWTKEIEMGINMYPNPTKDMVTIDIRNYTASQTEVAVFSITGSEVIRKTYPAGETIRFSMNDQVSGVYLVKMNIDGNHIIKKLVVDKK
jgi:hypothetical protein